MLCVVSHDAGGAELLASYVAHHGAPCEFVLDGPALKVFERRLGTVSPIALESALARCDELLTGSSWQSDLEWQAIVAARKTGKRTTTFLDHWGHYRERFIRHGVECLPDTLWVGDAIAERLARNLFPTTPVQLVPNPYFEDIREELSTFEPAVQTAAGHGLRVLFVCEPLSEHGLKEYGNERHWGYTEFDALRYFFSNRAVLGKPLASLVIRPHPSEAKGKYDQIAREFGEIARLGGQKPLLQEIAESDVVVGCESMAMVVGLIAGRRVIATIPPGGHPCSLPQPEIESLQVLQRDATLPGACV
ncbi:MAG: hypothetical protein Q8K12_13595 [Thiobacillus sp.]|nr:hypothetical protein [Thiobacillus sp.]